MSRSERLRELIFTNYSISGCDVTVASIDFLHLLLQYSSDRQKMHEQIIQCRHAFNILRTAAISNAPKQVLFVYSLYHLDGHVAMATV